VIKSLKLIAFIGIVLLSLQIQAVEPYKPQLANPVLEPWRWTDFPGYDTIRISCMTRERDNGIWMGIGNKAIFYDGYKTIQFAPDSTTIHSLAFEKDNNLLAATSNGIFRYKEGEFRKILNFSFNGQRNFVTDLNGDVWIGCEFGLLKITPKTIFCLNPEGYFEIVANGLVLNTLKFEKANDYRPNSIKEIKFPIYNLTISRAQRIWMAVDLPDKNIAAIDISKLSQNSPIWKYAKTPSLSFWDISGICEHNNSLWVTSGNPNIMLLQYSISAEKWKSINLKAFGGDNVQTSILETSDGNLWIGGHSKLYSLTASGWNVYQYPEVTLPLSQMEIYADSRNNIFVFGSNGSLKKLDLSNKSFGTFLGLNFQCNTPDGKYWFTTYTGEVAFSDPSLKYFLKYSKKDGLMDMAMSVYYSPRSGLWVAGSHNGKAAIARFEHEHWTLTTFPDLYLGIAYDGICELGDSAIAFPVNGVLELDNTNFKGGFIAFNYKRSTWQKYSSDKVPQRIPSIGQTSNGNLWFSGGSLTMFDGKKTHQVELPAKSLSWTDDIGITPSDHIWVAQGGTGLFYNDGKKWTRFTTFNGLASNMVTNLYVENDSSVYVASDKGISFFDGKQFIPQIINPELTIQRERGFLQKSADGALWINQGTREWYLYDFKNTVENPSIFKTTFYRRENNPPKTTISFSNREISSAGNVIITYNGIDFWNQTPSDKIQFSYRLNNKGWSPFSGEKSSVFLDLNAGDYVIDVRSRDLDNNIEPKPARISFQILPPVYLRGWFILTILTFLGIIVWLLIRLYERNKHIHELDQLKLRLFTDISHELKTPLTLISLPLQKLIDKAQKRNEPESNLELIYNNVQRLNNLVNQVVDFRRLEAGKIQLEISPGDVILQLRNISNYYSPLAHEKNIRFEFSCNIQEFWAKYDADKLEKIVVNLLSNAFKFTPESEKVELIVRVDPPADKLQVWVNDSGPGIPKDMQQNVFDRFYRLRGEKFNRIPGSGIGLSLVKELISLHQGSIEVISDGIHGTSFYVVLPLIQAEKTIKQANKSKADIDLSQLNWGEKASVLLIEDEEPMLRFVTEELKNYFAVKGISSVEKAFELLNTEMFDLIISDVMLPGMTGIDFCKKLKSDPITSHLPVILLTARDSEEDIVEGLSTGADDYITKPFRMNELIARCFNLIENRRRMKDRFADQEELEVNTFVKNPVDHEFLDKAIRMVYENIDNSEFDVPQFCQSMNTSKTLLYSKLKSLTGQSATEFVRNIRLKEAKKLLLNNSHQYTISEISYMVGFNDPLYFSRCFRKYFGVPPSEVGRQG
jgi:signal transduction histidine kinase/DNA-binding response OmpR family regulator/ligand-binding sensor domain-containing protein